MSGFCGRCENYAFFVLGVEFAEKKGVLRGENSEFSWQNGLHNEFEIRIERMCVVCKYLEKSAPKSCIVV